MALRVRLLLVLGAVLAVCVGRPSGQAGLLFSTTFDCPKEWNQTAPNSMNDAAVCAANDLMTYWGGWTTEQGRGDQIVVAANNPLGKGMGMRHWRGGKSANNLKGQNVNGGGVKIDLQPLGANPRNIWLRWYMRYQQGFRWASQLGGPAGQQVRGINYTKELYINAGRTQGPDFTTAFAGPNGFGLGVVYPGQLVGFSNAPGWNVINGCPANMNVWDCPGDGKFHAFEFHFDSVGGIMETWVDGKQNGRATGRNLSGNPIIDILVGSNQCCVEAQPDMYTDYDDIAISTTGYIGPLTGTPPSVPRPTSPGAGKLLQP